MVSAHALGIVCTAAMALHTLPLSERDELLPLATNTSYFRLGDKLVTLNEMRSTERPGYTLVSLHPDETQLRNLAKQFVRYKPSKLITLDPAGSRLMEAEVKDEKIVFDPSRVLSYQARKSNLQQHDSWTRHNAMTIQLFGMFLSATFREQPTMINLHNVDDYTKMDAFIKLSKSRSTGVLQVTQGSSISPGNFVVTWREDWFKRMKEAGLNAVLIDTRRIDDDGSLMSFGVREGKEVVDLVTDQNDDVSMTLMLEMLDGILK